MTVTLIFTTVTPIYNLSASGPQGHGFELDDG